MVVPALSPLDYFRTHFGEVSDPRNPSQITYPLDELLFLVLCAVISDCNTWVEIEDFGQDQLDWLRNYYPYEEGIPRSGSLNVVISMIDHQVFARHFSAWVSSWVDLPADNVINLDGKTSRGSKGSNGQKAVHLVNAFANELQMVLGQVATEEKSNEITAIPKLLELLSIKGCIITIDAMGTQKLIAKQIIEAEADYVLALKENHPEFLQEVRQSFERLEPTDISEQTEKNKSRLETRKIEVLNDWSWVCPQIQDQWVGLKQMVRVHRRRENTTTGKVETETSYYITSRMDSAQSLGKIIRSHWGIENRLHWRMDVLFREDHDRKRAQNSAANFSTFRKMAQNLLLNNQTRKASILRKRKWAARDTSFREEIIQGL